MEYKCLNVHVPNKLTFCDILIFCTIEINSDPQIDHLFVSVEWQVFCKWSHVLEFWMLWWQVFQLCLNDMDHVDLLFFGSKEKFRFRKIDYGFQESRCMIRCGSFVLLLELLTS